MDFRDDLNREQKVMYLHNAVKVLRGSGVRLTQEQEMTVKKIEALLKRLERKPSV